MAGKRGIIGKVGAGSVLVRFEGGWHAGRFGPGPFLGLNGLRDADNLGEDWVSDIFMCLSQAPIAVMIENLRTDLIWKNFMSNPEIGQTLKKLEVKTQN
jgi:hypothetical protein